MQQECDDTPLMIAYMKGHMQQECDNTPLAIACIKGHIDTAKVLLDHGAIIDHPNTVKSLSPIIIGSLFL